MTQGQYRALIRYSIIFTLALFIAGCDVASDRGGGSGGLNGGGDPAKGKITVLAKPAAIHITATGTVTLQRDPKTKELGDAEYTSTSTPVVTYKWTFVSMPVGSVASFDDPNIELPSFNVTDAEGVKVEGTYILQLVTSYEGFDSERAVVSVEVVDTFPTVGSTLYNHDSYNSQCVTCHNDGIIIDGKPVTPKPSVHISSSEVCQACHSIQTFARAAFVDHKEVFGSCSTCHNGILAVGKSPQHVVTEAECSDCHKTNSFLLLDASGNYDHANTNVYNGCEVCHNGVVAIGKDSGTSDKAKKSHESTADCFQCHVTDDPTGFEAARDHADLTNGCIICHGVNALPARKATPKSTDHPVIASDGSGDIYDCNVCHNTLSFTLPLPRGFNHSSVDYSVQTCDSCHVNGTASTATKAPASHFGDTPVTSDCGMCHFAPLLVTPVGKTRFTFNPPIPFIDHAVNLDVIGPAGGPVPLCASCHDGDGDGLAVSGLSLNHMPLDYDLNMALPDCGVCHTPGTFASGIFTHEGNVSNCLSCHNGSFSIGISINHIDVPVDQQCGVCHATDTFAGAAFHSAANVVTVCANCHDGVKSTGLSRSHLPLVNDLSAGAGVTTQDCSLCHSVPDNVIVDFTTGTYHSIAIDDNDVAVGRTCATCHNTVIATGKNEDATKPPHLPSLNDCETCHVTKTIQPLFAPAKLFAHKLKNGNAITRGCGGCHNGAFVTAESNAIGKAAATRHLPTEQDCDVCHTGTAAGDFATPISPFAHVGISGKCESCHDGTYFVNATTIVRGKTNPAPSKTHVITASDCGICHYTKQTFNIAFVDHSGPAVVGNGITCMSCHSPNGNITDGVVATPKSADHVPTQEDCGVCHVSGTFIPAVFSHVDIDNVEIVDNCVSCHKPKPEGSSSISLPSGHVSIIVPGSRASKDCSDCHNTTSFAGAKYDHTGIVDSCAVCHDGITAIGKHTSHVPTSKDCNVCHVTTGFKPATFDHAGIVDNCISCHDDTIAIGISSVVGHIVTNGDCFLCHTTTAFLPATFDHSIAKVDPNRSCDSCHNGSDAKGLSANHITTPLDCRSCHTTLTFVGGTWFHDESTAKQCLNCHVEGGGAKTWLPRPNHFDVTATTPPTQCDACHTTNAWAPVKLYTHTGKNYPVDHSPIVACISCHTQNSEAVEFRTLQYEPSCAGCHAIHFEAEGDHIGGRAGTIEQNKDCGASGCHGIVNGEGF